MGRLLALELCYHGRFEGTASTIQQQYKQLGTYGRVLCRHRAIIIVNDVVYHPPGAISRARYSTAVRVSYPPPGKKDESAVAERRDIGSVSSKAARIRMLCRGTVVHTYSSRRANAGKYVMNDLRSNRAEKSPRRGMIRVRPEYCCCIGVLLPLPHE